MRQERRLILELTQEQRFTASALPFSTEIAWEFRDALKPMLENQPKQWPHSDRALACIAPILEASIRNYHERFGQQISELFEEQQLERLDTVIARELLIKVAELNPRYGNLVCRWRTKLAARRLGWRKLCEAKRRHGSGYSGS